MINVFLLHGLTGLIILPGTCCYILSPSFFFPDDSQPDDSVADPDFNLEGAILEADDDDGDVAEINEIPDPAMETLGGECSPMTSLAMH